MGRHTSVVCRRTRTVSRTVRVAGGWVQTTPLPVAPRLLATSAGRRRGTRRAPLSTKPHRPVVRRIRICGRSDVRIVDRGQAEEPPSPHPLGAVVGATISGRGTGQAFCDGGLRRACIPGIYTEYAPSLKALVSVPHALLALLSEGPKYGLRLQSEFESRTGEVWPLNVGQVYTTLQRLERDGLVETDDGGRAVAEALPDHRRRRPRARRLAAHAARPRPSPARRARDQGAGRPAGSRDRHPRDPAGAPPARDRGHAALHAASRRTAADERRGARARRRRGALPARGDRPLARRRRRPRRSSCRPPHRPQWPTRLPNQLPRWRSRHDQRARTAPRIEGLRLRTERGARAPRRRPLGRARRARGRDGPERLGQEHAADDRRQPRGARAAARCSSTASTSRRVSRSDRATMRRRSIGYVFQDFNLLAGADRASRTSRCRSSSTASARRPRARRG